MKTYKRHRTLSEVIAQCKDQNIELRTKLFEEGNDHISLHRGRSVTLYAPFNGRFLGIYDTPKGKVTFNSDVDIDEPWYQALVEFFYTDEDPPT